jgi:hypothetical protein
MTQFDTVLVVTVHLFKRRIEFRANFLGTQIRNPRYENIASTTFLFRHKLPRALNSKQYVPVRYGVLLASQIGFWDIQFIL